MLMSKATVDGFTSFCRRDASTELRLRTRLSSLVAETVKMSFEYLLSLWSSSSSSLLLSASPRVEPWGEEECTEAELGVARPGPLGVILPWMLLFPLLVLLLLLPLLMLLNAPVLLLQGIESLLP